ncbi:MAG: hypothetical protein KatS3mg030_338 [Saprospiraceae bacterium]|nr:MAG: hypothetical protein KatS3mg030_338 [Saprospiraceae bacterium]
MTARFRLLTYLLRSCVLAVFGFIQPLPVLSQYDTLPPIELPAGPGDGASSQSSKPPACDVSTALNCSCSKP